MHKTADRRTHHHTGLGVLLTSAAGLGCEVTLSRVFTVAMGSQFASLVLSMALLGHGAAGTFLTLFPGVLARDARRFLSGSALMFSAAAAASYAAVNRLPLDPAVLSWDARQPVYLLLSFAILSVPFFFCGLTVAGALVSHQGDPGRVRFMDLLGAGAGCALSLPLLSLLRGETAVLAFAAFGVAASFAFRGAGDRGLQYARAALLLAYAVLAAARPAFLDLRISPYSPLSAALRHEGARILETRWNSFSRADLLRSPALRYAPGLSLRYLDPLPGQAGIAVDGRSLQALTGLEEGRMGFLSFLPSSLVYRLAGGGAAVLVIEPGGGLELLSALYHGAGEVTGIESNPLVSGFFRRFSRGMAAEGIDPSRVRFAEGGVRGILRREGRAYDVIQLPLTDALGASSGFSSGEDWRLTKEAFREYLAHLREGGYLTLTCYLRSVPSEEGRILATAAEVLGERALPGDALLCIRSLSTLTLVVKNGRIGAGEIGTLKQFCGERNFDLVYYPGMPREESNRFNRFATPLYHDMAASLLNEGSRDTVLEGYLFDISPVSDDAPFFYSFFDLPRLRKILESVGGKWEVLIAGGYLPYVVAAQALFLSAGLIVFPLLPGIGRGRGPGPRRPRPRPSVLLYFALLGAGYMFVEVPLIGRFSILFDSPSTAMAAVLGAMLVSSGLGSLYTARRARRPKRAAAAALPAVVAMLVFSAAFLGRAVGFLLPMQAWLRLPLAAAFALPLGFALGMPFPLGIRALGQDGGHNIPWAWCANGSASVVGASLALAVAGNAGYSAALAAAGALYACAGLALRFFPTPAPGPSSART